MESAAIDSDDAIELRIKLAYSQRRLEECEGLVYKLKESLQQSIEQADAQSARVATLKQVQESLLADKLNAERRVALLMKEKAELAAENASLRTAAKDNQRASQISALADAALEQTSTSLNNSLTGFDISSSTSTLNHTQSIEYDKKEKVHSSLHTHTHIPSTNDNHVQEYSSRDRTRAFSEGDDLAFESSAFSLPSSAQTSPNANAGISPSPSSSSLYKPKVLQKLNDDATSISSPSIYGITTTETPGQKRRRLLLSVLSALEKSTNLSSMTTKMTLRNFKRR